MNFDLTGIVVLVLKTAGKEPLMALLQALHDKDLGFYAAVLASSSFALGKGAVEATKSKTDLDDAVIGVLQEVVTESAAKNNVTLYS